MKWLQNIILFFGAILLYLHIYIHFKISGLNEFNEIDNLSKEKITSAIYYKLPFVFDGSTIIKPISSKDKIIERPYESLSLLEPDVRFFPKDTIYKLKKNKTIDIHRNLECRNFYMIHSGKVLIYCIHPKYISNVDVDLSFLEQNEILRVELYPNSILFVPNYWSVYVKAFEKSIVEKVQYKTILNEVNFLYDKYK
jgi:hypothetical protein